MQHDIVVPTSAQSFSEVFAELQEPELASYPCSSYEIREPSAIPESVADNCQPGNRRFIDELRRGFHLPRVEGRIVHTIHRRKNFDNERSIYARFTQVFKRFIAVSQHNNHFHVLHDCSSRGSCRHVADGGSIRLSLGVPVATYTMYRTAERDLRLENLLKYVDAPDSGRRLLFVFSSSGGLKSFRDPVPYNLSSGLEEANDIDCPDMPSGDEQAAEGGEPPSKKVKRETPLTYQQAAKLAAMEGVWSFEEASRIGSLRKHPVYGEQILTKRMNKKSWELFVHKVDTYLGSMLQDYNELNLSEKKIYWDQFSNPGFGVDGVEDVAISATRLINIIQFNFADPANFLNDVVTWFNNGEIKRRTLVFTGPADSFKSWVARGMCRFLGKAAKMEPFKKGSTFGFAALTDCNVGLFEEAIFPIFAPEYTETMKSVMEGNSIEVNVKYQNATPTISVPILMTSNALPWTACNGADRDAFEKRAKVYTLFNVPAHHAIRENNTGKPCNPLAWFDVFAKFGIQL